MSQDWIWRGKSLK
uniref:Uncharacterized protein n=1 Tax=Lepeophtheirus salmonis TaxID=72036 RepID=A0A0K2VKT4_LEPSM